MCSCKVLNLNASSSYGIIRPGFYIEEFYMMSASREAKIAHISELLQARMPNARLQDSIEVVRELKEAIKLQEAKIDTAYKEYMGATSVFADSKYIAYYNAKEKLSVLQKQLKEKEQIKNALLEADDEERKKILATAIEATKAANIHIAESPTESMLLMQPPAYVDASKESKDRPVQESGATPSTVYEKLIQLKSDFNAELELLREKYNKRFDELLELQLKDSSHHSQVKSAQRISASIV
jgi:hypothetical protein